MFLSILKVFFTLTEQLMRDEGKPLFGNLPGRQSDCLRALVKVAATYSQVVNPEISKQHCIVSLSCKILDLVQ